MNKKFGIKCEDSLNPMSIILYSTQQNSIGGSYVTDFSFWGVFTSEEAVVTAMLNEENPFSTIKSSKIFPSGLNNLPPNITHVYVAEQTLENNVIVEYVSTTEADVRNYIQTRTSVKALEFLQPYLDGYQYPSNLIFNIHISRILLNTLIKGYEHDDAGQIIESINRNDPRFKAQ